MSSSGKGQNEKIKMVDVLKSCLFIFGAGGIAYAIFNKDIDLTGRIFCSLLGVLLCATALVSAIRWVAISLLAFGVGCAGIPNIVLENGEFDLSSLLTVVTLFAVSILFGYKAFRHFRFNRISNISLAQIDAMSGLEFEHYTAKLLKKLGYKNVSVTKASGDQGIDVLAEKDSICYAIQCKNYANKLDNTPVQEAFAGKQFYGCDVGVVITNSTFTEGASELAGSTGVLLWDRLTLQEMILSAKKQRRNTTAGK